MSTRLLAQIKLRETQRQRDRLHRLYDAIEARLAGAVTPVDRLRTLHAGLRDITFAQKPLHPDVANLDALYLADELGTAPPELVADRTRLLEREMAQGRLRAEFTYAFGRILSEWAGVPAAPAGDAAEDPLARLWDEPPAVDLGWVTAFFEAHRSVFGPVAERVGKFGCGAALAPATNDEVVSALSRLRRDPYALPPLRRQAGAVLGNPALVNEYAGVLSILLNSLDEWEWPAEGVPSCAVWAHVKHRPYADADLLTAVFLQVIGERWLIELTSLLFWRELRDGKEPLFRPEPPSSPTSLVADARLRAQEPRFAAAATVGDGRGEGGGYGYAPRALLDLIQTVETEVRFARLASPDRPLWVTQADLRDFYPSLSHDLILAVLERLGVPPRWRDFFRKFLAARVRYRGATRPVRRGLLLDFALSDLFAECVLLVLDLHVYRAAGVPVVRVVDDLWLFADSRDRAAAAWREVGAFCRACGLEVNTAKSGAVVVGGAGEPPEGAPPGGPRWGLLRLQADGTWQVDEPAFAALEATVRREADATASVLGLVTCYNKYLQYILWQVAPPVALRGGHLRRAAERLGRMHEGLFGAGHGLAEEVHRRLRGCFADARLQERGLPPALLYWPATAGGLALAQPTLQLATYLAGLPKEEEFRPPDGDVIGAYLWKREWTLKQRPLDSGEVARLGRLPADGSPPKPLTPEVVAEYRRRRAAGADRELPRPQDVEAALAQAWAWLYENLVTRLQPSAPPPLPAMERLVEDFIKRGGEVSGRRQQELTPYWRWVVYAYGPSLLDALGTFRFLLTELVPLPLVVESRGAGADAIALGWDGDDGEADEGSEFPF